MTVHIAVILDRKGADVATIAPDATLADATARLAEHNIGALVVSRDGQTVEGMLSERDIVRNLAGAATEDVLSLRVADVMSTEVTTCTRESTADELMATMTNSLIRHVPVVEDGRLAGIVSIGDVVKSRMDELEIETVSLQEYVMGRSY